MAAAPPAPAPRPCTTFSAAHAVTDANGEINCLDAGNFGTVTITKSITIDCAGTVGAISGVGNGVTINTPGVVVRLRNLTIDGSGGALRGIEFLNGAALFVENCVIANQTTDFPGGSGIGIKFDPPAGVTARLFVSDSVLRTNRLGSTSAGDGIRITAGPGTARVVLSGARLEDNGDGIQAQSLAGSGGGLVAVHIRNSVAAGNSTGIFAATGDADAATVSITVDRSSSLLNAGAGVRANGPLSFILLGRSDVIANGTGLAVNAGGQIFSYQNNHLNGNTADGTPTAVLTLK